MVRNIVILAGGSGTRLWPASRSATPKQFLRFQNGVSLFQQTLLRALATGIDGVILVVSHQKHVPAILEDWKQLRKSGKAGNISNPLLVLPEPVARNTAPAIALACQVLSRLGRAEETLLVQTADHVIQPVKRFTADLRAAAALAEKKFLVTFGIPPRSPDTGFGYIETGDALKGGYRVRSFHEKPDMKTAQNYLGAGNYFWNSGMFIFRPDVFLAELSEFAPQVAEPFARRAIDVAALRRKRLAVLDPKPVVQAIYRNLPSISVDYAVMEKSRNCAMVRASFDWSDIGSWDEVFRVLGGQSAEVWGVEAENNLVFSEIPVALAGVRDLIVVVHQGTLLICRKGSSQMVRQVVQKLEKEKRVDLL